MNRIAKLDHKGLERWFSALADDGSQVFWPDKAALNWRLYNAGEPVERIGDGVPLRSIKEFFFPQPETLLEFSRRSPDPDAFVMREPARRDSSPVVVAGVRPCDARSITLNSLPYADDPYFRKRREQVSVIGFLCSEQGPTCFCTWTGGSPFGMDGLDVAVASLPGGELLAASLTERGALLLEKAGHLPDAADDEIRWFEDRRIDRNERGRDFEDPAARLVSSDMMSVYNAPFWQEIADSCLNCGACTFLCPTCYCFDIQDEKTGNGMGRRIRYWDSCMFPLFTQHASGHNPRGEKVQRCRNRFMHKLRYFPERFGPLSCVGCGRCIRACPVNIDIREVMREMLAVAK